MRLLAALALISVIAPLGIDTYLPAFPQMAEDLGVGATTIQVTLTMFMLGMAAGQLVVGPFSDGVGRRRPLIATTVLCLVATLVCAFAPNALVLIVARFVQGFAGGGGAVLARAILADLTTGADTARGMNLLMAMGSIAPILAPTIGGALLLFTDWRGIFVFLAVTVATMVAAAVFEAPESRPESARRAHASGEAGVNQSLVTWTRGKLKDRAFVGYVLAGCLGSAAMFSYISGSSFVYQQHFGLNATQFSLAFGANAIGMTAVSLLAARQAHRWSARSMLIAGLAGLGASSAVVLVLAIVGAPGFVMVAMMLVALSFMGLVHGNSTALALMRARENAGTASALVGALQFSMAALVSPAVGLGNGALIMPAMMLAAASGALLAVKFAETASPAE